MLDPQDFDTLLASQMRAVASEGDLIRTARVDEIGLGGLVLARQRRMEEADQRLRDAERLVGAEAPGSCARLYAASFTAARRAYWHFAVGQSDQAVATLAFAFEADLGLEKAGVLSLVLHRVQLIKNLVRVELAAGRREQALMLVTGVLRMIEGCGERAFDGVGDPWERGWPGSIPDMPPHLVRSMHAEHSSLLLTIGIKSEELRSPTLWRILVGQGTTLVESWLRFESARQRRSQIEALRHADFILRLADPCSPPLVRATVENVRTLLHGGRPPVRPGTIGTTGHNGARAVA